MKQNYKIWLSAFALLLCGITASAQKFEVNGIYYSLDYYKKYALVFSSDAEGGYAGDIVIPSTVTYSGKTYPVTKIHESAFKENMNLTSVVIPESITEIPTEGFYGCSNLESVTIPKSVKNIFSFAFAYCSKLSSITIPEGVQAITSNTFYCCHSLTSVTIPNGVTKIGESAFQECRNLESVSIPQSVTYILSTAFAHCLKLSSINIPDGVKTISDNTFYNCVSLTSITIPNSVTEIKDYAFWCCHKLESVTLSSNLEAIGNRAFSSCPFSSIILPESLSRIGTEAFAGCHNLSSVTIPKGVTTIKASSFCVCDSLATVILPEGLTKIESSAFSGCGNLTSITLPQTLRTIESHAFFLCEKLTTVDIPKSVTSIGIYAFQRCNLNSVVIPDGVDVIEDNIFEACSNLTTVTLPQGVREIGSSAFRGCTSLASIALPSSLKKIGEQAFSHSGIEHITIPEGVTEIKTWTFSGCKELKTIDIPEGVTIIGREAFHNSGITSIVLPESLKEIDYLSFVGCDSLHTIVCKSSTPPSCSTDMYYDVFDSNIKSNSTLFVPDDYIVAYQEAEEWKDFNNMYPLSARDKNFTLTYLVDGEVYRTYSLKFKDPIPLVEEPTKEGHTFSGWSEIPEVMPAEDVTVTGTFTANKYLVTFKIDGEVVASDSLEYGAAIVTPETPEREGYTFSGWGEVEATMPDRDLTYEANYTINSYEVVYLVDGEEYHRESVEYGSTIVPLDEPTKKGYEFSGWSELPTTMPAHNITVTGTFIRAIYLTIQQADNGYVRLSVNEGDTYRLQIVAAEGWKVHTVTFNDEDVTENITKEGFFTTPAMLDDAVLNIAFEQMGNSEVNNARANAIKVYGSNNQLHISGTEQGDHIAIYDTKGILVTRQVAYAETIDIEVEANKIYIVKVSDKIVKIQM